MTRTLLVVGSLLCVFLLYHSFALASICPSIHYCLVVPSTRQTESDYSPSPEWFRKHRMIAMIPEDYYESNLRTIDTRYHECGHFDIKPSEKLVDYRGTSTPWEGEIPGMKKPQPSIWGFDKTDKPLKPTESHYSGKEDAPLTEEELMVPKLPLLVARKRFQPGLTDLIHIRRVFAVDISTVE